MRLRLRLRQRLSILVAFQCVCVVAAAHVPGHPSFQDAMASLIDRLCAQYQGDELRHITPEEIEAALSETERRVLATEYLSFDIDKAAVVWIARSTGQREVPFWLDQEGFSKTGLQIQAGGCAYELWRKSFPGAASHVGLGVDGFGLHRDHYFVVVTSGEKGSGLNIANVYPGRHRVLTCKAGARIYADDPECRIEELPAELDGQPLVQALQERCEESQLINVFRTTPYPASANPDQVVLTWDEDPSTCQTIQWRTRPDIADGIVRYRPANAPQTPTSQEVIAARTELRDRYLANDPVNSRFTAELSGLAPDTTYTYIVGSPTADTWSSPAEFTTAPAGDESFSFVYLGDVQNGLDAWGDLVHRAFASHPEAAFCIMAGDLVNRGNERDDWDSLFHNAADIFNRRPVVPAIGNHECQGEAGPWMYLAHFDLPRNGPKDLEPERAYSVRYSNALFVVLDTNQPTNKQMEWLDQQLATTAATWKFVIYHHPAYSSAPNRDNARVRDQFGALFDKYHVDMALQGHDHAYLRTYPMRNGEKVGTPREGTIYVVAVSGTKFYPQTDHPYTERGLTNVSTFQILDIRIEGNTLTYRAVDGDGVVRDEFVIAK